MNSCGGSLTLGSSVTNWISSLARVWRPPGRWERKHPSCIKHPRHPETLILESGRLCPAPNRLPRLHHFTAGRPHFSLMLMEHGCCLSTCHYNFSPYSFIITRSSLQLLNHRARNQLSSTSANNGSFCEIVIL